MGKSPLTYICPACKVLHKDPYWHNDDPLNVLPKPLKPMEYYPYCLDCEVKVPKKEETDVLLSSDQETVQAR